MLEKLNIGLSLYPRAVKNALKMHENCSKSLIDQEKADILTKTQKLGRIDRG